MEKLGVQGPFQLGGTYTHKALETGALVFSHVRSP